MLKLTAIEIDTDSRGLAGSLLMTLIVRIYEDSAHGAVAIPTSRNGLALRRDMLGALEITGSPISMLKLSSSLDRVSAGPRWSGIATALILAALASGCTERKGSGEESIASETTRPSPQELFVSYCASCHGIDGVGDGPLATELRRTPANLRLLKQNNNGEFPTQKVQRSIDGRGMPRSHGLPDMPVWGMDWIRDGLNEAEVKARAIMITSYIASIQD